MVDRITVGRPGLPHIPRTALIGLTLSALGCGAFNGKVEGDPGAAADPENAGPGVVDIDDPDGCVSNREFLARSAWGGVLRTQCLSCHGPGGVAEQQNSDFRLLPSAYPGFLDVNLDNIDTVSRNENEGISILLRKPLGELEHGGGAVLASDSPEYQILSEMVTRTSVPDPCGDGAVVPTFDDVILLDPAATFRKASLHLASRPPTAEELAVLASDGEAALPALLGQLMTEDAFYTRLIELMNDQLLTDRYLNDAQNLLRDEDFPESEAYYDTLPDEERSIARRSLAREPLELIAHIVRNDRPYTEILTANYTVLNGYTARIYNNTNLTFADYQYEFQEGQIYVPRDGAMTPFPHAGVLTSPIFLNRYPTSPTNRNRHRAYILLREFLATDILKVGERPIDPTQAVNFANPTREDPACRTCHVILDPLAGAFQKFDDRDYERYLPDREWYDEMLLPGFEGEQMQVSEYAEGLQWVAARMVADPRFAIAAVNNVFEALTGSPPLGFPEEPGINGFIAWETQDAALRAIGTRFVEEGYNLKTVVREIILSPYFRAANAQDLTPERAEQLASLGTGRLLTPELLQRKIRVLFGYEWGNTDRPSLLNDYRMLYGGIDSNLVTQRLTTPNGIMSGVGFRMANELSCRSVAWDLNLPQAERRFFPYVNADSVPRDEFDRPSPNVEAIQQNLQHLYSTLLGETLATDSAEMARVYQLFEETWIEGNAKMALEDDSLRTWLGPCEARENPLTGEELPEEQRLRDDPNYVVRSWMAVMTYLLSDYRFLYE